MAFRSNSRPQPLVDDLRDVIRELQGLSRIAERFSTDVRATSLTLTLEAVKLGMEDGRIRDLAVRIREQATQARERLVAERARVQLSLGQALARASRLARQAQVLGPSRARAELIGLLLTERVREVRCLADHPESADPEWLGRYRSTAIREVVLEEEPCDAPCVVVRDGAPVICVPVEGGRIAAALDWARLGPAVVSVDLGALARALVDVPERPADPDEPVQTWLVADGEVLAATVDEAPPLLAVDGVEDAVTADGRQRVAAILVPRVVAGVEGWRILARGREPRRSVLGRSRQEAEIIPFPG